MTIVNEETARERLKQYKSSSAIKETAMPIPAPTSSNSELAESPEMKQPANQDGQNVEACPLCGQTDSKKWLSAPDLLHDRQHKYTLVRCPACAIVWRHHPPRPN